MTDYAELRAVVDAVKPGDGDAMLAYRLASGPTVIRALLAERDALAAEAQEQARLLGGGAERELRLVAERDALRTALSYYLSCFEQHNITNTHGARDFDFTGQIADMARAALAQGQEEA